MKDYIRELSKGVAELTLQGHNKEEILQAAHDLKDREYIKRTWEELYDKHTSIEKE